MRDPWPESVRRTIESCRTRPAHDVLSSGGWAELRQHCGELAVELDALGYRTIAQRIDRDYARVHSQLREATPSGTIATALLRADAIAELASTLAAIQRFRAPIVAADGTMAEATRGAGGVTIRAETVNVQGQAVTVADDQIAPNGVPPSQASDKRGKAGMEKWRRAQERMLERLRQGTLPRSLRDTARTIGESYDTTRRAAYHSDALRTHFKLADEAQKISPSGSLLDELAKQADRRTQQAIAQMTPTQRTAAEEALREMDPGRRVELLQTLSADPEAGSAGDVSLIEESDQDSRADDGWSA